MTTDADGEDCYRRVKEMGRFVVVKRTPGISTTDLVGRMLLCTKTHHIATGQFKDFIGADGLDSIRNWASDEFGQTGTGPTVKLVNNNLDFETLVPSTITADGAKLVYVDGGFDLFTPGHVEFLRRVHAAQSPGQKIYVIAGVHDDATINQHKGLNYPIMNMFERGLCVLQCRYIDAVVFGAPFAPDGKFLEKLEAEFGGKVEEVWHGPTQLVSAGEEDTYAEVKRRGLYREVEEHEWSGVNAREIVNRILMQREVYEERQRKKGVKAEKEKEMTN